MQMSTMTRKRAVGVMLCVSNGWSFPMTDEATRNAPRGLATLKSHPSCLIKNNHACNMVLGDKKNLDADDVSDTADALRQTEQSENILGEYDEDIDWETLDAGEMNDLFDYLGDEYVSIDEPEILQGFDKETLLEILGLEADGETITISEEDNSSSEHDMRPNIGSGKSVADLETALNRGVVPVNAGVGSESLPADFGFDPLGLSTRNYFKQIQLFLLNFFPEKKLLEQEKVTTEGFDWEEERPPALILRDYREAEIRHGRIAMLAAVVWPLQEILDRIFIPESFESFTVVYGGPTLPFLPLVMTFFLLNLGYLDIYSSEIKKEESGDAFLPGECFWDPLCILDGVSDSTKRNMQVREILNGRAAMIAVAAYVFEEAMTHMPIISIPTNAILFEPAYQLPVVQKWLDCVAVGHCIDYRL